MPTHKIIANAIAEEVTSFNDFHFYKKEKSHREIFSPTAISKFQKILLKVSFINIKEDLCLKEKTLRKF